VGPPWGPHAEYLVVPEGGLMAAIPEGLTFEEAAPGSEGSH
jgi:NADPH:quinone reductase-like Zn-dependent oxidoreductase